MVDIMGTISGNISTIATADGGERESTRTVDKLDIARQIDGVAFDGSRPINHWGRCDTSGSVTEKSVPCEGFSVIDGSRIVVLFAYSHLGNEGEFTLNVNNTGARPIFYAHENATPDNFKIIQGDTYEFVFDGTHNIYRVVGDYDTNTEYDIATSEKDGLMSKEDKAKLDRIYAEMFPDG